MIIFLQMLVIGIPAVIIGSKWWGVNGVFGGLAFTYILGGIGSYLYNNISLPKIIDGFRKEEKVNQD